MATNTDHDVADDGEEGDGAEDDAPERGAHVVPAGVICRQPRPLPRPRPRPRVRRGGVGGVGRVPDVDSQADCVCTGEISTVK